MSELKETQGTITERSINNQNSGIVENKAPVFLLDKQFAYPFPSCGWSLKASLEYIYWYGASSLPVFTKFAASLEQFGIDFALLGLVIFHFGLAEANEATVVKEERDWCSNFMLTTNGDFTSVIFFVEGYILIFAVCSF